MHRYFGMTIISGAMACTDLDDPLLLTCMTVLIDGALVFDVQEKYGFKAALGVQLAAAVLIVPLVRLSHFINEMDEYAKRFALEEVKIHEEHDDLGPESRGDAPVQCSNDLGELMGTAAGLLGDFDACVAGPLHACVIAGGWVGEKVGPNLKGEGRAREKAYKDYDSDFAKLCDLLRCTIVVDDYSGVLSCFATLSSLEEKGILQVVRIKNRFKNGSIAGAGYCDANISVNFRQHMCEVQLQYRPFL
jgi:hypothetical protein